MRASLGKIGKQESVSLTGLAITLSVVFTLDGSAAYAYGNATYLSLPLSVALALGLFLLLHRAMRALGAKDLFALCRETLGVAGEIIAGPLIVGLYAFSAWAMLERFTSVLHGIVFVGSGYAPILLWVVAAVLFTALRGFECLGRMAKIVALFVLGAVLLQLAVVAEGYALYRLSPFPAGRLWENGLITLSGTAFAFPPLMGLLCAAPALQGEKNVRLAGAAGALIALVLVFVIQLFIGMAFTSEELKTLAFPLMRVDMILLRETFWFRIDLLGMFILLVGAMVSAAWFVYAAASVVTKLMTRYDVRPPVVSLCTALACLLLLEHLMNDPAAYRMVSAVKNYAFFALAPFPALAAAALIKAKVKGGKTHEAA